MSVMKFGKSFNDVLDFKKDFFENDSELHNENIRQANIYRKQPRRVQCKNCEYPLKESLFSKHNIDYFLCERCNHLNGEYEDTEEYVNQLYLKPESDYAKFYRPVEHDEYIARVRKIYNPKVEFMLECLRNSGESPDQLAYCDFGAGSGHFVYSLKHEFNLTSTIGFEVSEEQVLLANQMLGEKVIEQNDLSELKQIISHSSSSVVSMIGVLEHLINPRDILSEISKNNSIKYLFLSLPLFSFSVYMELVNQERFNRLLSGGHTHLYTQESIKWFCEEYHLESIGQWNFGADAMDLYRYMLVNMQQSCSPKGQQIFSDKFSSVLDDIQVLFDKQLFSSETHILLRKKDNNGSL